MDGSSSRLLCCWLACGAVLCGCASPGRPVSQVVRVETPGCPFAACELRNDRGVWQLPRTPAEVTLTTSRGPLTVRCRADDGEQADVRAASRAATTSGGGAVAGGVLAGATVAGVVGATALTVMPALGVLAVLTGATVGAVGGDAVESGQRPLRYPDLIVVRMSCPVAAAPAPRAGVPLGLVIRGLSAAQAHEAGLPARAAVEVLSVAAGGRAAAAGLREGDLLLAAAGQALADAADLEERLRGFPQDAPLALQVWRDGVVLTLALPPAALPP